MGNGGRLIKAHPLQPERRITNIGQLEAVSDTLILCRFYITVSLPRSSFKCDASSRKVPRTTGRYLRRMTDSRLWPPASQGQDGGGDRGSVLLLPLRFGSTALELTTREISRSPTDGRAAGRLTGSASSGAAPAIATAGALNSTALHICARVLQRLRKPGLIGRSFTGCQAGINCHQRLPPADLPLAVRCGLRNLRSESGIATQHAAPASRRHDTSIRRGKDPQPAG
jgi:hypothetical protein